MHERLDRELNRESCFTEPYSIWQRGHNQNTNRLARQHISKSRKLKTVAQEQLLMIEEKLNNLPRKCLGFQTLNQVFNASLKCHALSA